MRHRLGICPTLWALPFGVMFDGGLVSVGVLCVWWCFEWRTAEDQGLVELRAVGEELAERLR